MNKLSLCSICEYQFDLKDDFCWYSCWGLKSMEGIEHDDEWLAWDWVYIMMPGWFDYADQEIL